MKTTERAPTLPQVPHLKRPPRRSQRGFSLIEVMLATLLMGYAIASMNALFTAGQSKAAMNSTPTNARFLANEIRLLAQLLPKEPSGTSAVTSPDDVVALDSLHGAVFSPPILANLSEYENMDDWEQSVAVRVAALAAPEATGTALTSAGISKQAASLFEVQVTVSFDGEVIDTWTWWVKP